MPAYDKKTIADLIDGKLEWSTLKRIISDHKDSDRFEKVVAILQERVPWKEKILLPLAEHLYVVQKGKERIVKAECGYEFGDYRQNWKHKSKVFVRNTPELLQEMYRNWEHSDPQWQEMREFYCPGCYTLLDVEVLPPGYPVTFDFVPDLEGFYKEILKKPLPES
jgi:acetone carboxylase gamma subunit